MKNRNTWLERTNPLTRLSIQTAQNIYDTARNGALARLQFIYSEIERTDPILMVCVERRLSALSSLGWRVSTLDDTPAAAAQKERLERILDRSANLSAAIEHLGLSFFRGFSVAEPYMDGETLSFNLPESWTFNHAPFSPDWWYNPSLLPDDPGGPGQRLLNLDNVILIERPRAIDYPALAIFLRHDVAEEQWGRFLERYGIPPVILTMPELANPGDADRFAEAARNIYDALCGAVPNGTGVNTLAEARAGDPFTGFIEHQEKTLVRLATGGTLGSIAEAQGLGSGAAGAQQEVWEEIVRRDAVLIGEAFNRFFAQKFFAGKSLVKFELGTDKTATPDEIFDLGAKARAAGYKLTLDYLQGETGTTLEPDTSASGQFTAAPSAPLFNAEPVMRRAGNGAAPDLAASLENALLQSFADSLAPEEPLANAITNPCPKCHRQMSKEGECAFCAKRAANHVAGKTAWRKARETKSDVIGAMERDAIGMIDFIYGDDSEGVAHIFDKHPADADKVPGVIAYGDIYDDPDAGKFYIVKKRSFVSLRKMQNSNHYVITGFTADSPDYIQRIRRNYKLVEKGD